MEQKLVRVPFEVELAKKITEKTVNGKVVTRNGRNARIICFDAHCDDNIVALIEDEKGVEYPKCYVSDGYTFLNGESDSDLMLEIPEYMTFKDGDVIAYDDCDTMAIIKAEFFKNDSGDICSKSYITILNEKNLQQFSVSMNGARLATEEEKQKLIDALKASKDPKAKECLKMLGIEQKQEYEFKPFDKVLVRDEGGIWFADIFSHYTKNSDYEYKTAGGDSWEYCIPYNDRTKHLLGTTEKWEE